MAIDIQKIDNGRYKIRAWSRNLDVFGKRKTKQITTKKTTIAAAQRMAAILEDEISEDKFIDIKFIDLYTKYKEAKKYEMSITTSSNIKYQDNYIISFFREIKAKDISTKIMQDFISFLSKKVNTHNNTKYLRNESIKRYIQCINAALNWGVANDILEFNRVISRSLKYNKEEIPFQATIVQPETIGKILAYLKKDVYNLYIPALLTASMSHRNNEALGETWSDFDRQNNILKINNGVVHANGKTYFKNTLKTKNSKAELYITDFVKEELIEHEQLCAGLNSEFICANPFNDLPTPDYLTKTFPKVIKNKFGIKMRFYDLRHYFNQTLYLNGYSTEDRCLAVRNTVRVNEEHYTHKDAARTENLMKTATNSFINAFKNYSL